MADAKKTKYRVTISKTFYYDFDVKAENPEDATELALELYYEARDNKELNLYIDDEGEGIDWVRELVTVDDYGNIIEE